MTPDDLLTAIAVLGLFVATSVLTLKSVRTHLPPAVPAAIATTATGWCALGLVVLLGSTSPTVSATLQYSFLTLTSLLMLMVPVGATALMRSRPAGSPWEASAPGPVALAGLGFRPAWASPAAPGTAGPAVPRSSASTRRNPSGLPVAARS